MPREEKFLQQSTVQYATKRIIIRVQYAIFIRVLYALFLSTPLFDSMPQKENF
jgi:hypothetical protein